MAEPGAKILSYSLDGGLRMGRKGGRPIGWLVLALLLGGAPLTAQSTPVTRIGSAELRDVPDVPSSLLSTVQRYRSGRSASLADWFDDGSLLVQTNLGGVSQLYRVAGPEMAREQLTFGREPVAAGFALRGARRFAFVRDSGGDEWFQILVRRGAAPASAITDPETRNLLTAISPDRTMMAWSQVRRGAAGAAIAIAPADGSAAPRIVYHEAGSLQALAITPDNKAVAVARIVSPTEQRLLLVDIASGAAREVYGSARASVRAPHFSPDGRTMTLISNEGAEFSRLVAVDLRTGARRVLTPAQLWDIDAYDLSPDGRTILFAANVDGYSELGLIDVTNGRSRRPPPLAKGVIDAIRFAPDGRRVAISMSTPTSPGDVWTLDLRSGTAQRWTSSELGEVDPESLVAPTLIRFRSFDGLSVPAFVYRPKARPAGGRTPVVIDVHGGPEFQVRPAYNSQTQMLVAQLGAAVIQPNIRGSAGYGKAYMALDNGALRENSIRDIGALLDWIATQPDLDPQRVAITGGSYGGYVTLAALTFFSDRLAGGAARYGVSNFITFLESTAAYRRDRRRPEYGDERDPEMRALLTRISPLTNASRIKRPLLLLQGANDPRVPQREADQMAAAVRANGVPVWYVLFGDEGHGFLKEENDRLALAVQTLFLQRVFAQP